MLLPVVSAFVLWLLQHSHVTNLCLRYFQTRLVEVVGNWRSGAPLLHSREKAVQAVVKPDRGQVASSFLQGTRLEKRKK